MEHRTHTDHAHVHGADCGHTAIKHDDHVDYLHDGHLHSAHGDHIDEHVLAALDAKGCKDHSCDGHDAAHAHGTTCGHEPVPHGDHTDYLVASHLHNAHDGHCDEHGVLALA